MPCVFISTGISRKSPPSHAGQGCISWMRSLLGSTASSMPLPSAGGASYTELPVSKLSAGTSGADFGGSSLNSLPAASVSASVMGLKDSLPAMASAVTISGLPMKFIVVGCPSLRRGKLRLYEVTMVLARSVASLALRH